VASSDSGADDAVLGGGGGGGTGGSRGIRGGGDDVGAVLTGSDDWIDPVEVTDSADACGVGSVAVSDLVCDDVGSGVVSDPVCKDDTPFRSATASSYFASHDFSSSVSLPAASRFL
jgi:hypothetical protein